MIEKGSGLGKGIRGKGRRGRGSSKGRIKESMGDGVNWG